jgi:hypothetical protein
MCNKAAAASVLAAVGVFLTSYLRPVECVKSGLLKV